MGIQGFRAVVLAAALALLPAAAARAAGDLESGDSGQATAGAVAFNQTYSGTVGATTDQDTYVISTTAARTQVQIRLQNTTPTRKGASYSVQAALQDAGGAVLANTAVVAPEATDTIYYTLDGPGTHNVVVSAGGGIAPESYTLTVTQPTAAYEPNDSPATAAAPLVPGQQAPYLAGLETLNDQDFYVVYTDHPATEITINVHNTTASAGNGSGYGLRASLLAADGSHIADSEHIAPQGTGGMSTIIPDVGTHYLMVVRDGLKAPETYSFTVTGEIGTPPAPPADTGGGGGSTSTPPGSVPSGPNTTGGQTPVATGPVVTLARKRARITKRRRLALRLDCPAGEGPYTGVVSVRASGRHHRRTSLGRKAFRCAAGSTRKVVLRVSRRRFKALRRGGRHQRAAVKVTASAPGTVARTTTAHVKLTVPRHGHRRHHRHHRRR